MASNRDLAARALDLGRELGEEVETAGLNNAKLTELVAALEASLAEKAGGPGAEVTAEDESEDGTDAETEVDVEIDDVDEPEEPEAEAQAVQPEEPKPATYRLAPGKAVATESRGVQGPGAEVTAEDFPQGIKRLEQLLAAGYLVKR